MLATLAALAIGQWFVLDWYEVRGNSMQPLLVDRTGAQDRVLVLAPAYAFAPPQRFDLVVFDRPKSDLPREEVADISGDRCVKRVIAFSNERPYIEDGDLFLEPAEGGAAARQRLRRPLDVIERMIVPVATLELKRHEVPQWAIPEGSRVEEGTWIADASERTGGLALRYDSPIRNDFIDRDGRLVAGSEIVNDVGLEFDYDWQPSSSVTTSLRIELREQADVFSIVISSDHPLRIERRRGPVAGESFISPDRASCLPRGRCHVRALNCDDEVLVWVDGEIVAQWPYPGNEPAVGIIPNAPALILETGAARFSRVTVVRDAYYTRSRVAGTGTSDFSVVPAGRLFVLGDNSVNSVDSRDFGPIDAGELKGRPIGRYRPDDGFSGLR